MRFLQDQMVCWVRSKDGYKETKEWVPFCLRKAIQTPFPSEDKVATPGCRKIGF